MRNIFLSLCLAAGGLLASLQLAAVTTSHATATPSTSAVNTVEAASKQAAKGIPEAVLKSLSRIIKTDLDTLEINPAPIEGLYEVVAGMEVVYISATGQHLVIGDIRDAATGRNITDVKRMALRSDLLENVSPAEMVIFPAKEETKHVVNVFTDVDCPYCTKIHEEVEALNEEGIEVRYLAFPRAGVGSKTYQTMVSVWCAGSQAAQQVAMTDAKNNRPVKPAQCENPVKQQYELGQQLGVSGTPSVILSNGELIPGYVPAQRLVAHLRSLDSPFLNRIRQR